jgi:hypothetical protein
VHPVADAPELVFRRVEDGQLVVRLSVPDVDLTIGADAGGCSWPFVRPPGPSSSAARGAVRCPVFTTGGRRMGFHLGEGESMRLASVPGRW